ncbi:MAG: DUF1501 domain-containing protein [Caldilinea sp. CFX5]|nr:DUF1501 domain-containing protein [Caldilinea sp. CFX5]
MNNDLSRRTFLRSLAAAPVATLLPAWMPRLAFAPAQSAPRGDTLVVLFLRGAADALNMVVPHGEDAYYAHRPTLGIARPDDGRTARELRTVDLDGFFGFHPMLAPLLPAWQEKALAIVHACGAPDESRSHFRAMALMERGVTSENGPASGWLGRHLATHNTGNRSPLRAIGLGERLPMSIRGPVPASALRSIADFHLGGDEQALLAMQAALNALYTHDAALGATGVDTISVMNILAKLNPDAYRSAGALPYPESELGMALKQVAMLIKAEVGLEVAAIDHGGWDTHFVQGGSQGQMATLLADLGQGLAAFHADLFDHAGRLAVIVMSEFGRRLQENGSLGTDHGHGGLLLALGGNVVGGQIHGRWPGLAEDALVGPGDLAVTTDYRDVLGELCSKRLNNSALTEIFPGYTVMIPGVFKS